MVDYKKATAADCICTSMWDIFVSDRTGGNIATRQFKDRPLCRSCGLIIFNNFFFPDSVKILFSPARLHNPSVYRIFLSPDDREPQWQWD